MSVIGTLIGMLIVFLLFFPLGFTAIALPAFVTMTAQDYANLNADILKALKDAALVAMCVIFAFFPGVLTYFYYVLRTLLGTRIGLGGAIAAAVVIGLICAGGFTLIGLKEINTPEGGPSKLPDVIAIFGIYVAATLVATLLTYIVLRMFGLLARSTQ